MNVPGTSSLKANGSRTNSLGANCPALNRHGTQQRPELPTLNLTWYVSTYKVNKLHQRSSYRLAPEVFSTKRQAINMDSIDSRHCYRTKCSYTHTNIHEHIYISVTAPEEVSIDSCQHSSPTFMNTYQLDSSRRSLH